MARSVKKKEHENLTPANIRKVAALLEAEKPISKKEACEILNISYNTARLQKIIENQKTSDEVQAKRRKEKRGTPVTIDEVKTIVQDFLIDGDTISDISARVARPTSLVKKVLSDAGVPPKPTGDDRLKTSVLPELCISTQFQPGEVAWSAVHHGPVTIRSKEDKLTEKYGSPVYRVWVHESADLDDNKKYFAYASVGGYNAFVIEYDLGSLKHIQALGIKVA